MLVLVRIPIEQSLVILVTQHNSPNHPGTKEVTYWYSAALLRAWLVVEVGMPFCTLFLGCVLIVLFVCLLAWFVQGVNWLRVILGLNAIREGFVC